MNHCPKGAASHGPLLGLTPAILCLLGAASCEGTKTPPQETPPSSISQVPDPDAADTSLPEPARSTATAREEAPGPAVDPVSALAGKLPASEIQPHPEIDDRAAAPDEYAGWSTYRVGRSSFRYPKGWSVETTAYGLVITPAGSSAADELIIVTASAAPGVTKGTDPSVGAALDLTIASSMPAMRRRGRPREVRSSIGSGGRFDYAGRAPDGRRAEGSVYVAVDAGKAAAISIVAEPRRLEERRPVIEQIFQSFGSASRDQSGDPSAADVELDPRLIGTFAGEAIHSGSGTYVSTRLVYRLGADGVLHYGAQSAINASQGDGAGGFKWTASGVTGGNVERGTWSTAGGMLTVEWDSGAVGTVAYGFEPDGTLALRDPVSRKLINFYQRVK